jgi:spermidine synthase
MRPLMACSSPAMRWGFGERLVSEREDVYRGSIHNSRMSNLLISEHHGLRTLHFGSEWVQGQMRISKPADLALGYAQEMTAPLLFVPPAKTIYVAGLGVGALPRWALANWSESLKKLDIVELRGDVIALTSHAFPLPLDDARVKITEGDAAKVIALRGASTMDWIWVDCYDGRGRVGALESAEFYAEAHRVLKKNGVFVANMWSNVPRYYAGLRRLAKLFGHNILLLPSVATENVIVIASKTQFPAIESDEMRKRAKALTKQHKMPFDRWIERMALVTTAI